MKIVILGAGVQGTVFAVRLAQAGHQITLVSRPARAAELRRSGATIQNLKDMRVRTLALPVLDVLPARFLADICLVTVRREQIETVLPDLVKAVGIPRIVFLVNHANGSDRLLSAVGRSRTVLAFPGIAGDCVNAVVRYLDIPQQRTVVEETAPDVVSLLREAGLLVDTVCDMDAWLMRHAVFVTAIAGALYLNGCNALLLANDRESLRLFILAVREGWATQDREGLAPPPFALRVILCWVPLSFSLPYWSRLLASPRGDIYFARHCRHSPQELAALAADLRNSIDEDAAPSLHSLLESIDAWLHNPAHC